ncbi:MAG: hypothetical protein IPK03_11815 [Bacteroidetes bacterium]|nr:hypothetical protein [Bacteroidota bacterium]
MAQGSYIPLQSESYHLLDRMDILDDSNFTGMHMGIKPFDRAKIFRPYQKDSFNNSTMVDNGSRDDFNRNYLYKDNMEWNGGRPISPVQKPLLKVFYKEEASLLVFNDKDFTLRINPVIQLAGGSQNDSGKYLIENRKGVEVRGTIARKVSFYTLITDNQERLPDYGVQYANGQFGQNNYVSIPGNTYYKPYKTDAYDYFNVRGYVNFNFLKYFDIQLGHDKNFYGNGVRSLFLSDQAAPYFFFKLNTRIWKINYQNVFAELTHQYVRGLINYCQKNMASFII